MVQLQRFFIGLLFLLIAQACSKNSSKLFSKKEIKAIEDGEMDAEDNPLKHAPHTIDVVSANEWNHAYSREQAAYPLASLRDYKYWSPVGRVDNVYGDTHLICSCPPLSAYEDDDA